MAASTSSKTKSSRVSKRSRRRDETSAMKVRPSATMTARRAPRPCARSNARATCAIVAGSSVAPSAISGSRALSIAPSRASESSSVNPPSAADTRPRAEPVPVGRTAGSSRRRSWRGSIVILIVVDFVLPETCSNHSVARFTGRLPHERAQPPLSNLARSCASTAPSPLRSDGPPCPQFATTLDWVGGGVGVPAPAPAPGEGITGGVGVGF